MKNNDKILEQILELFQESFTELFNIYHKQASKIKLIIPKKADNNIRISEQELRFALIACLEIYDFLYLNKYSVETPTQYRYSFSGNGSRSAASDISIYSDSGDKVCNIELKAHNPQLKTIEKDVEKICRENVIGVWGHLFENQDSGTVKTLFEEKLIPSLKKLNIIPQQPIFIAVGILSDQVLLTRKVTDPKEFSNPENIFNLDYSDFKNQPKGKRTVKGWQIYKVN